MGREPRMTPQDFIAKWRCTRPRSPAPHPADTGTFKALASHRAATLGAMVRLRTTHPRVFGFVLQVTDSDSSDLDLLVPPLPGTTLFDLGGLQALS